MLATCAAARPGRTPPASTVVVDTANRFRVDFTVPDGTAAGAATLRLSAAWIQRATVRISAGR